MTPMYSVVPEAQEKRWKEDVMHRSILTPNNINDDIHMHGELGSGAFGLVHLGTFKGSNQQCAVKIIKKQDNPWAFKEIEMLSRVNHPNCQKMIKCYEDEQNLYIVNEVYTGGELFDFIARLEG